MKITLDLDQLLHDGRLTREECQRLRSFAAETTGSLALNLLLVFGIVAVAAGAIALLQSAAAALVLGFAVACVGGFVCHSGPRWSLLGNTLLPVGALTGAGGLVAATQGSAGGFALVAVLLLAGGVVARSGLLTALSVFALLSTLGGATGYEHAAYYLCVQQPLLTVVVFGVLAAAGYFLAQVIPPPYARLANLFASTAVVVANFGFWIGSLWGDEQSGAFHSDVLFIVGWAVSILAMGVWGARTNHRWLVNTAATFGAIHLYTQWFEHLGATPASVIAAGLVLIGAAYALLSYNRPAARRAV